MNYQLIEKRYEYREQNPDYKGEQFDRDIASGPTEQRKCRDCFCLLLYLAFWGVMIIIAGYAFANGNPQLLAAPFDSSGRQCGHGEYEQYPLAYYNRKNYTEFGCVQSCPSSDTDSFSTMLGGQAYDNSRFPAYKTIQIVSLCFPISEQISKKIHTGLTYYDQVVSDIRATWKVSLIALFSALLMSILLLFFIRTFGGCIVITIITLYMASLVGLGIACMSYANGQLQIEGYEQLTNPENLRVAAYVCWALAAISLLALCCSLKKIRIAAAVLRTAADFTRQECRVIIAPLLMFVLIAVFFLFWIFTSVYIFSCGQVRQCKGSPYACIDWDTGVKRSLTLFLFGLFWNCEVAISICQFVIASTAAYWYFSHLGHSSFPLIRSFCRAFTYQLGSLVFGSLVLCIVWTLQILLQVLHYLAKNQTLSSNPASNVCSDYLVRCARCCLACFQRFVRFVTKNAFLMMAITGEGFCTAAHQAFYLAMRTAGEYAITHGVGHTMMFFAKLLVSASVTFFSYLLLTNLEEFEQTIYSPFSPAIFCFVISWVVGSFFMDIFAVAADTFLLCYSLELDVMKGISYACPPNLKAMLDSHRN